MFAFRGSSHARVIFIMTRDSLYPKVASALAQVTARKGRPGRFLLNGCVPD
jgi:glucosamine 6-phosphate synthetase-like amidotransferase/phosphosugar isomerase protein